MCVCARHDGSFTYFFPSPPWYGIPRCYGGQVMNQRSCVDSLWQASTCQCWSQMPNKSNEFGSIFFGKHKFVLQFLKKVNLWEWFKIRFFVLCFQSWLVCSHFCLWRRCCRCQWWTDGRAKDSSYGLEHEDGYAMQDYASLGFFGLSIMVFVSVWFSRGYHALLSLLLNEGFEDIADMQGTSMATIRHSKRLDCQFHPG